MNLRGLRRPCVRGFIALTGAFLENNAKGAGEPLRGTPTYKSGLKDRELLLFEAAHEP